MRDNKPTLFFDTHVFCCINERAPGHSRGCCKEKEASELRDYMKNKAKKLGADKKIRINTSGCLDRCEQGPVMVIYPEAVWYSYNSREDVDEILERHIKKGELVERLMLPDYSI